MMKKIMKSISSLVVVVLLTVFSVSTSKFSSAYYDIRGYVINKYDVNIYVNENNTFNVTETITAHFNKPMHGIVREIPLKNKFVRSDGSTSDKQVKVSNVSVNEQHTNLRSNDKFKIRIGDEKSTVTGEQTYVIKYTYDVGVDVSKTCDELYYNIISDEWNTKVNNVTFKITMPKDFDASKLSFSGEKDNLDNSKLKYNVEGNTITGRYEDVLSAHQTLAVKCELPEGYFVREPFTLDPSWINLMFIIPILGFFVTLFFWLRSRGGKRVVEAEIFYPPKDLNSLEVGSLYKGTVTNTDVISLLIYLANKGYIKICETGKKRLFFKSKNIKIVRLKKYDGDNAYEQAFLDGLFKCRKKPKSSKNVFVVLKDLKYRFFVTLKFILSDMKKMHRDEIIEKSSRIRSFVVSCLIFISMATIFTIPSIEYIVFDYDILPLMIPIYAFDILWVLFLVSRICWYRSLSGTFILQIFVSGVLLIFLLFIHMSFDNFLPIFNSLRNNVTYRLGFIVGIICVFGMIGLLPWIPQRTECGNEMLGKLKGFRQYLKTADEEKLKTIIAQDPMYFYDMLPYAYVLDVSNKWMKKFESISLPKPSWYDISGAFNVRSFRVNMRSIMNLAFINMTMSPWERKRRRRRRIKRHGRFFSGGGSW